MSFDVPGEAYAQFMGRYSEPLAAPFLDVAGETEGRAVLDVGCGPGALSAHLLEHAPPSRLAAVDPSEQFVAAATARCPGVEVRLGAAEHLPYADGEFDLALAELVVHFMADPVAGLREMGRVCVPGGTVAACVWDWRTGAVGPFWDAVHEIDPAAEAEENYAGAREGHLAELFAAAGLSDIVSMPISVTVEHSSFDDWWQPYTLGVGPAGDYVAALDPVGRRRLEDVARARFPDGPFTLTLSAWAARGTVG
ncbi:class I SAM-dependent methyltransferase [Nocardioides sp. Kera G14]|uniref:class I SAM-dependent methyltransferase n=1 Tax=Nocardioides sp. Kera G14 TaxID=2884264 RepID=UPI001D123DF3|nr:class I SAM-dependent methyltransferase [Nocardioides sp. Kera G14]UDY22204.1 class I SAM-dependent methyltransferase [Nocardioides sp. Kera G14]